MPPLTPQRGDVDSINLRFEEFRKAWTWQTTDSVKNAERQFGKLTPDEQGLAIRHAGDYEAACAEQTRTRKNASAWLSSKGWQLFAEKAGGADAVRDKLAAQVWIERGTPQFAAWRKHRAERDGINSLFAFEHPGQPGRGCWRPTAWPPTIKKPAKQSSLALEKQGA